MNEKNVICCDAKGNIAIHAKEIKLAEKTGTFNLLDERKLYETGKIIITDPKTELNHLKQAGYEISIHNVNGEYQTF